MKFLVPNYSCLQNPWLRGYRPQIPFLSVLNWICWTPPEKNSWVRHWESEFHYSTNPELSFYPVREFRRAVVLRLQTHCMIWYACNLINRNCLRQWDWSQVLCVTEGSWHPRATGNSDVTPQWQDKECNVRDARTGLRKCWVFPEYYRGRGVESGEVGRMWEYSDCMRSMDLP